MTAFLIALYRAPFADRTLDLARQHGVREDWARHYIATAFEMWPVR